MGTHLQPGTAAWKRAVAEGIKIDASRNWRLGDIALTIAPITRVIGAHSGNEAHLHQYADEISVSFASLYAYRAVASAWPVAERVEGTSWKAHQVLMGAKHKIRPGMTVTQAMAAAGHSTVSRERVQRRPVYSDDSLMSRPATEYRARQSEDRRNFPPRESESVATLQDLIDAERVNDALLRLVERIRAGRMDAMPGDVKIEAAGIFRQWIDALQWALVIIEGGGAVTDQALAEFLDAS